MRVHVCARVRAHSHLQTVLETGSEKFTLIILRGTGAQDDVKDQVSTLAAVNAWSRGTEALRGGPMLSGVLSSCHQFSKSCCCLLTSLGGSDPDRDTTAAHTRVVP